MAAATTVRDLSRRFWDGDPELVTHDAVNPLSSPYMGTWEQLQPGLAFVFTFGNVTAVGTVCADVVDVTPAATAPVERLPPFPSFNTSPPSVLSRCHRYS
jgi:hypothetical protein